MYAPSILIFTVLAIGILHTLVPDHWVPITLIARQRGWSLAQTARAAAGAGLGHVISTLVIAIIVWVAGVAFAARFGHIVDIVTSLALMGFGGWVAHGALREIREQSHDRHELHGHDEHHGGRPHGHHHHHDPGHHVAPQSHAHIHRHANVIHVHSHAHAVEDAHEIAGNLALDPPPHIHEHSTSARTAMLLILGSSPMVEGIPAFFAASRYGVGVIVAMSIVFAISTIATYVGLCVASTRGLQRIDLGPIERYGEVISGSFIALLGLVFLFIH